MQKYIILILLIGLGSSLFSQSINLELDTINRLTPTSALGGQTWRGPSWVDTVFNDSVSTMYPDILSYPPCPDIWDWGNGWFYPQSVLDTCLLDSSASLELSWGQLNATVIDITPMQFQNALNQIGAQGLYCMNMISSNLATQSAFLRNAKTSGVQLERIRLGDEMAKIGNESSNSNFPLAGDYARLCNSYIDSIRVIVPNAKIAISAGNFYTSTNDRARYWNDSIFAIVNDADALRWSSFIYLRPSDSLFSTRQLLAYPFDQIPKYESVRGFQDTISELQDYEIWVGYSITDNTLDHRFLNRWSLVLMFSAAHNNFLDNKLVEDISLFNVGGIFENWDALDTQNQFRKRATGIFASIWNRAKQYKMTATRIKTPTSLMDTVTYFNNNNISRLIEYPKLFGWRFENYSTSEASVVLTNISSDTICVSISNLLTTDILWEKWSSDSIFAKIESVSHIQLQEDSGAIDVLLPPYSINVATGSMCSQSSSNSLVTICEGDSVSFSNSIYFIAGVYIDTLINMYGCDSIITLDLLINTSSVSFDTISANSSYNWNGNTYTISNDYSDTLINSTGCDSILNLNLTISNTTGLNDIKNDKRFLIEITDILGQETPFRKQIPLFYIYDDGSVEKKIVVE